MLVLTRRLQEAIVINGNIRITVLAAGKDRIRLGIEAPQNVRVDREEVHRRIAEADEPAPRAGRARAVPV